MFLDGLLELLLYNYTKPTIITNKVEMEALLKSIYKD